MVVAAAASAAVALTNRGSDAAPDASAATTTEEIAATWVDRQVGHGVIVACDPAMCTTLRQHGFPGDRLLEIKPSLPFPTRAQVVVETPGVEHQFGTSLAASSASQRLASFGSGSAQISVRIVTPAGPAAYRAQLAKDAQSRRRLAGYLLDTRSFRESAAAKSDLVTGQVDTRLIIVLTALTADNTAIDIVSFGPRTAGESSDLPLRSVNLSVSTGTSPASRAAFVRSVAAVVDRQPGSLHRSSDGLVRIAGKPYFQITFSAPSPLGLLPGGAP